MLTRITIPIYIYIYIGIQRGNDFKNIDYQNINNTIISIISKCLKISSKLIYFKMRNTKFQYLVITYYEV